MSNASAIPSRSSIAVGSWRAATRNSSSKHWRRVQLHLPNDVPLPQSEHIVDVARDGQRLAITTDRFSPELMQRIQETGAATLEVQRMSLEEIFVANVMRHRKELAQ